MLIYPPRAPEFTPVLLIFLVFRIVLLCVFTFWVPCCAVRKYLNLRLKKNGKAIQHYAMYTKLFCIARQDSNFCEICIVKYFRYTYIWRVVKGYFRATCLEFFLIALFHSKRGVIHCISCKKMLSRQIYKEEVEIWEQG